MTAHWSAKAIALSLLALPAAARAGAADAPRASGEGRAPVRRANPDLAAAGAMLFVAGWVPSVALGFELATASSSRNGGELGYLLSLPVLPPLVFGIYAIAHPAACGYGSLYGACGVVGVGMVLASAAQGIGLWMLVAGAVGAPASGGARGHAARARDTRWGLAPGAGGAALGLSLTAVNF